MGILLSVLFFLTLGLAVALGWLKGKKYVWQYTLTRFLISVLAVVIAVPLTKKLSSVIVGAIFNALGISLFGGDVIDVLPSAAGIIKMFVSMMLGLFLFFFVRLIIKNLLKLFVPLVAGFLMAKTDPEAKKPKIVVKTDSGEEESEEESTSSEKEEDADGESEEESEGEKKPDSNKKDDKKNERKPKRKERYYAPQPQPVSIAIAIVGCVLGVIFVLAPFTGLIGTVDTVISSVDSDMLQEEGVDAEMIESVRAITSNASVKVTNVLGGKLIFNTLTKYKLDDNKVKLKNEINLAAVAASNVSAIASDSASKDAKIDALNNILDAFESSSLIPIVLSDVINAAATELEAGNEFMGIKTPSGENGKEDVSSILMSEIISSYKGCTPESIKSDVRTAGNVFIVFINHDAVSKLENPESLISDEALMTALLGELFSNTHLSSLTSTFIEIGILMLEDGLGVPANLTATHNALTTALNALDTSVDSEEFKKSVKNVLLDYGIDVTDDGVRTVALRLLDGADGVSALQSVEINVGDEKRTVNISTPAYYETHSLIMTKGKVGITHKDNIDNPEREAEIIADALSVIFDLSGSVGGDDTASGITSLLTPAGKLLDALAACEMVGKEVVDDLILVIFQSEKASGVLPMNKVEITRFVNSLISATGDDKGYTEVMSGISEMIDVLEKVQSGTDMGSGDAVADALKNLTPESAEAIGHMITPDFMSGIGIDTESSEAVSNVLGSLFDNIANAQDSVIGGGLGLTEDEYHAETEMISNMLDSTMSMLDGEREELIEVGTFASSIMDSKILTSTVIDSVYDEDGNVTVDPMNTGKEFTESEEEELLRILNEKLDETKNASYATEDERQASVERTEKLAVAIGAYMNADLEIVGGEIVFKP